MKKHIKLIFLLVIISVFLICQNMNILAEPQSMLDDMTTDSVYSPTEEALPYYEKLKMPKKWCGFLSEDILYKTEGVDFSTEIFTLRYEELWNTMNTDKSIEALLQDRNAPAMIVHVTDDYVQYLSQDKKYGMTFTKAVVMLVLRNGSGEMAFTKGKTIYLKESYFYTADENGTNIMYCDYGAFQKPLKNDKTYLIFPHKMREYQLTEPLAHRVCAFDERYYWEIDIRVSKDNAGNDFYYISEQANEKKRSENIYDKLKTGLYSDYEKIQYDYYDKVIGHFGLLENQKVPLVSGTTSKVKSGPNLAAIFVSIAVLLALGALTYTVNETTKKSRQSKDT